jgi:WD40 repeat protein
VTFNTSAQTLGGLAGFRFARTGLRLYAMAQVGSNTVVYQYNLSVAWDSTAMAYATKSANLGTLTSLTALFESIEISSDGLKMLAIRSSTGLIYEFDFGTAYELDTLAYNGVSYDPTLSATNDFAICCDYSGDNLYIAAGNTINRTRQWDLVDPFSGSVLLTAEFLK